MRNGVMIMVDDERMRLNPGEKPVIKKVRFRTLGVLPFDGCSGIGSGNTGRDCTGNVADHHFRETGARDRL